MTKLTNVLAVLAATSILFALRIDASYGWPIPLRAFALLPILALVAAIRFVPRRRVTRARAEQFEDWAAENDWTYRPDLEAFRDTPFLAAGSRADIGCAFSLQLHGRQAIVYEHIRVDVQGVRSGEEKRTSSVVLRFPLVIEGIPFVSLVPPGDEASRRDRRLELESEELERRYRLEVDPAADEIAVRRLFSPRLIEAILVYPSAAHYLGDVYELEGGTLLLAGAGTIGCGDGDYLRETVTDVEPLLAAFLAAAS